MSPASGSPCKSRTYLVNKPVLTAYIIYMAISRLRMNHYGPPPTSLLMRRSALRSSDSEQGELHTRHRTHPSVPVREVDNRKTSAPHSSTSVDAVIAFIAMSYDCQHEHCEGSQQKRETEN